MAKERTSWLLPVFHGIVGNALYALAVLVFGGMVTYLSYVVPGWGAALLKGFLASLILIFVTLAWRIMLVLPPRRQPTTAENVEERIKEWLYKHNLTIKNDPLETTYFRLFVVTKGGIKIFIGRTKDKDSASILLSAEIRASEEEAALAELFSAEEKLQFFLELRLELSRAKIAYNGLNYVTGFFLTKSIPLSSDLGETQMMNAIAELEAVINSALVIALMAAQRHRLQTPDTQKALP